MTSKEQFDKLYNEAIEKHGEKGAEKIFEKALKMVSMKMTLNGYKLPPIWRGKGKPIDGETLLKFEVEAMKQFI